MSKESQALEILAQNICRYRLDLGLSQEEAAKKVGLSRAAYAQIEGGKSEPRTRTLMGLAEAFGVRLEELFVPPRTLSKVRFRAHGRLNTRNATLYQVARWLDDYAFLEEALGDERMFPIDRLRKGLSSKHTWQVRVGKAASVARKAFGLEDEETIRDICGLFEDNGIKLMATEVKADGFFGLSVGEEDGGPAVVVNTEERIPVERQIFTAAHELGHLILHPGAFKAEAAEENALEEKEANLFAGCFLMPEELFRKEWEGTKGHGFVQRVLKVKRIFHVSYKTVLYRISETTTEKEVWDRFLNEYKAAFGRTLEKTEEPLPIDGGLLNYGAPARLEPMRLERADFVADRFKRMVRNALEDEKISRSAGAQMLGITVSKLRELIESWETIR